jgi:hypothetical protein
MLLLSDSKMRTCAIVRRQRKDLSAVTTGRATASEKAVNVFLRA